MSRTSLRTRWTLAGDPSMDTDLDDMSKAALIAEVRKLRQAIRKHRDATGHDLCWHQPDLWSVLPERLDPAIEVPCWPNFIRGCVKYRESLDVQAPAAPRVDREFLPPAGE